MNNYPVIVIYSDHYVSEAENPIYVANNDAELIKVYKKIISVYWEDWCDEDMPDENSTDIRDFERFLKVNTYKQNWFDGCVYKRQPETI